MISQTLPAIPLVTGTPTFQKCMVYSVDMPKKNVYSEEKKSTFFFFGSVGFLASKNENGKGKWPIVPAEILRFMFYFFMYIFNRGRIK